MMTINLSVNGIVVELREDGFNREALVEAIWVGHPKHIETILRKLPLYSLPADLPSLNATLRRFCPKYKNALQPLDDFLEKHKRKIEAFNQQMKALKKVADAREDVLKAFDQVWPALRTYQDECARSGQPDPKKPHLFGALNTLYRNVILVLDQINSGP